MLLLPTTETAALPLLHPELPCGLFLRDGDTYRVVDSTVTPDCDEIFGKIRFYSDETVRFAWQRAPVPENSSALMLWGFEARSEKFPENHWIAVAEISGSGNLALGAYVGIVTEGGVVSYALNGNYFRYVGTASQHNSLQEYWNECHKLANEGGMKLPPRGYPVEGAGVSLFELSPNQLLTAMRFGYEPVEAATYRSYSHLPRCSNCDNS